MNNMAEKEKNVVDVSSHYDAVAEHYGERYNPETLYDHAEYPANYFRLKLLLKRLEQRNIHRVLEIGVGEGTPLASMAREGMDVYGIDISQKMIEHAKKNFAAAKLDPNRISYGDIQDSTSYKHVLKSGPFDGVIAMGVMPHVQDDDLVLENIAASVIPGGSVFIEFRNKLFSLFTFNRYTFDFILNDLLGGVDSKVRDATAVEISSRLAMDMPPKRSATLSGAPGYDAILSKFHNPFELPQVFLRHGFHDVEFLWYHYHATLPMLECKLGRSFREESFKLEGEPSGWRGMFLCSAFVVQATKNRLQEE